jgi:hypothetical protein
MDLEFFRETGVRATGIFEFSPVLLILLVFFLYLLVRPERVKRPVFLIIGCAAVALGLLARFFAIGHANWGGIVLQVFDCLVTLLAFAAAVIACYGGQLPNVHFGAHPAQGGQAQQPQTPPPPQ